MYRGNAESPDMILKDPDPKRPCRREDFVPHCDEEMQEWMEDRQKDLQAALGAGRLPEVARVSVTSVDESSTRVAADDPTAVFAVRSGQFCEVTRPRSGLVWAPVRRQPTKINQEAALLSLVITTVL